MPDRRDPPNQDRQELLGLFSISGSLAALCITVVALMNTFDKSRADVSVVDDVFAFCGAGFLLCTYLIFWALRTRAEAMSTTLLKVVDGIFLLTLTSMTFAGFAMMYAIL
jgi:hypothetical protein